MVTRRLPTAPTFVPRIAAATSNLAVQGQRGDVKGVPGADVPFEAATQVNSGAYRTGSPERDERFKEAMGLPTGRPAYTDATRPNTMTSADPTVRNRAIMGPARTAAQAPPQQQMTPPTIQPATYTNNWQRPAAAASPPNPSLNLTPGSGASAAADGLRAYARPMSELTEADPNRALGAMMRARGGFRG